MSLATRLWHYADNPDYGRQLRDDCREAAQTIERLQRAMNRANRIADKADRMFDAIAYLRFGTPAEGLLGLIADCKSAARGYEAAMSDPAAEATDAPATCRRCQSAINEGHDRG